MFKTKISVAVVNSEQTVQFMYVGTDQLPLLLLHIIAVWEVPYLDTFYGNSSLPMDGRSCGLCLQAHVSISLKRFKTIFHLLAFLFWGMLCTSRMLRTIKSAKTTYLSLCSRTTFTFLEPKASTRSKGQIYIKLLNDKIK